MVEEEANGPKQQKSVTFEFPIQDLDAIIQMKNIPLYALPNFHGLSREYPDTFMFEFDVLFRSYDYSIDSQKLKLFPTTLKDSALHWFMGLGGNSIQSWDDMKKKILSKYHDYCKVRVIKEDILKMPHPNDERLEEYVEIF